MLKVENRDNQTIFTYRSRLNEVVVVLAFFAFASLLIRYATTGDESWKGMPATALLLLIPAFMLQRSEFRFDRTRQELFFTKRWSLKKTEGQIPFQLITACSLETDGEGDSYRIILEMIDGKRLPAMDCFVPDKEKLMSIVNEINSIVGLKAISMAKSEDAMENEIVRLYASGREIDAVKLAREELSIDLTAAKAHCDKVFAERNPQREKQRKRLL